VNTVELPVPPSVNKIWTVAHFKNKARVTLSKQYRAWRDVAVMLCRARLDRVKVYPVCVRVQMVRGPGWRKGRDLDNVLKVILDALVAAERLASDDEDHVTRVVLEFAESGPEACARVTIEPIPAALEARAAA
jgi:Holliday junction resolvase RusA-like endonuclease